MKAGITAKVAAYETLPADQLHKVIRQLQQERAQAQHKLAAAQRALKNKQRENRQK